MPFSKGRRVALLPGFPNTSVGLEWLFTFLILLLIFIVILIPLLHTRRIKIKNKITIKISPKTGPFQQFPRESPR